MSRKSRSTSRRASGPAKKVVSRKNVRNDGTIRGREIGEIVVKKGEVGYVCDIGTFLQQFFIYAVEWIDRGTVVGMRAKELDSLDRPSSPQLPQGTGSNIP